MQIANSVAKGERAPGPWPSAGSCIKGARESDTHRRDPLFSTRCSQEPGPEVDIPISYSSPLSNSTFLDFNSWNTNLTQLPTGQNATNIKMNVALVLDRANDASKLLSSDWATRATAIADQATIWSTYGADKTQYADTMSALKSLGFNPLNESTLNLSPAAGAAPPQYITTEASRTIWVSVDETSFQTLFNTRLKTGDGYTFWEGSLSLPTTLSSVKGLWFDYTFAAVAAATGTGTLVTPSQGYQSPGNASTAPSTQAPQTLAQTYYKFPLGSAVPTGPIGLIEPGVGTALPNVSLSPNTTPPEFVKALDTYRQSVGLPGGVSVTSVSPGGESYPTPSSATAFNPAGERSLDFGVVTSVAPNSPLIAYAGSGTASNAQANPYTAYQGAFWDTINKPEVITSSFSLGAMVAKDSPFLFAARELFKDAALRGITVFNDNGDRGSGASFANGQTNVNTAHSSPFAVMVGGTSVSSLPVAEADATLSQIVTGALDKNLAIVWQLIAGGLNQLPQSGGLSTALLVETVWNQYYVNGNLIENRKNGTGFNHNNTASSGVDASQAIPDYQKAFGLTPTESDTGHATGRGTPDVAANAGSNLFYLTPAPAMKSNMSADGTSAATPLWAALAAQINAIFHDQGLPKLGYMNDLLYIAAAIAPGSFNDITIGNSTSSYVNGGSFQTQNSAGTGLTNITPTGFGYDAGDGYDLVTGLGTPNGTLLARTLTWIAHEQVSFSKTPKLLDAVGTTGWKSAADQALIIQAGYAGVTGIDLTVGNETHDWDAGGKMSYAWTARMAQQALQSDFDPTLVRMYDKHSQGNAWSVHAGFGESIGVTANGAAGTAYQVGLTSAFGMADFLASDGTVHLARAVAIAETVGAQSDQTAIVRMRQAGQNDLSVTLYRVDDANGHIAGLAPGAPGYAAAAEANAYHFLDGEMAMRGPGYGGFKQAEIAGVNARDLVAMKLTNHTTGATYWAFQEANGDRVQHLWNYGANTWGWEDTHGGGDRDYNDLVVQIDFTSAAGHGWLA